MPTGTSITVRRITTGDRSSWPPTRTGCRSSVGPTDSWEEHSGGWELSGVTRIQTGQYLTPTGSSSIPGTRRSEYLGGPVALHSDQRGVNKWFNTAAFANAP